MKKTVLQRNTNSTGSKGVMKIAIMQPYFLPYIGYYRLIAAVDKFVILDDVNYIKKGWINRNRILLDDQEHLFTISLSKPSQNKKICEIELSESSVSLQKLRKKIECAYRRAPYFRDVIPIVIQMLEDAPSALDEFLYRSLDLSCRYLKIETKFEKTSRIYRNQSLKGSQRILDICRQEGATHYLNPAGGQELYNPDLFNRHGLELSFLETVTFPYNQYGADFVPGLSILDVMMFNSKKEILKMLHGEA